MKKEIKTTDLFECKTPYLSDFFKSSTYPWDMLPQIKDCINNLLTKGIDGFTMIAEGVYAGKNVTIHPNAVIMPPAIIGEGTEIRPGAFIRGNVITGSNCVIGNSSELKNCILLDNVQIPHYNYVGDSILGNKSHMGAGSICSNLKSDGKPVTIHADTDYETGLRKIGGILGDNADVGCGCVLNPGTIVGKGSRVYPLTSLRGVYPANCIVKSTDNIVEIK